MASPLLVPLTLGPHDLHVQMGQAAGRRQGQLNHPLNGHSVSVEVIEQGAMLVVIGDEPQLCPGPIIWSKGKKSHWMARCTLSWFWGVGRECCYSISDAGLDCWSVGET